MRKWCPGRAIYEQDATVSAMDDRIVTLNDSKAKVEFDVSIRLAMCTHREALQSTVLP